MQQLFTWLDEVIGYTFYEYFEQPTLPKNPTPLPEVSNKLNALLAEYGCTQPLNREQWVILALALAPHFSPQTLDWFMVTNATTGGPYSEFGGVHQGTYFLPTAETAAFTLTAGRFDKRIELLPYFHQSYWLYASGMLTLQYRHDQDPMLGALLKASDGLLKRLCGVESTDEVAKAPQPAKNPSRPQLLDVKAARQSPCMECVEAMCCKIYHLDCFPVVTLTDFDKISYYLNFENIEVIFSSDGLCTIYYSKPCRFFKADDSTCIIHSQPQQTSICVHYSPYRCFYRMAAQDRLHITSGNIWLSHERLKRMEEMTFFDKDRVIAKVPSFDELVSAMDGIPYECGSGDAVSSSADIVDGDVLEPCTACGSQCCTHLLFPANKPQNRAALDFYKYTLGFEALEYIISDTAWALLVHTRCRHLNSKNRCSVYNTDDRPLICRYLDPYKCHVKQVLNAPTVMRVNYATLDRSR